MVQRGLQAPCTPCTEQSTMSGAGIGIREGVQAECGGERPDSAISAPGIEGGKRKSSRSNTAAAANEVQDSRLTSWSRPAGFAIWPTRTTGGIGAKISQLDYASMACGAEGKISLLNLRHVGDRMGAMTRSGTEMHTGCTYCTHFHFYISRFREFVFASLRS